MAISNFLFPVSFSCMQVLVIGGGDGGILRKVGKHQTVEEIHIRKIDEVATCWFLCLAT